MLYTRTNDVSLNDYFDEFEIIERFDWEKALYMHKNIFLPERYDDRPWTSSGAIFEKTLLLMGKVYKKNGLECQ